MQYTQKKATSSIETLSLNPMKNHKLLHSISWQRYLNWFKYQLLIYHSYYYYYRYYHHHHNIWNVLDHIIDQMYKSIIAYHWLLIVFIGLGHWFVLYLIIGWLFNILMSNNKEGIINKWWLYILYLQFGGIIMVFLIYNIDIDLY